MIGEIRPPRPSRLVDLAAGLDVTGGRLSALADLPSQGLSFPLRSFDELCACLEDRQAVVSPLEWFSFLRHPLWLALGDRSLAVAQQVWSRSYTDVLLRRLLFDAVGRWVFRGTPGVAEALVQCIPRGVDAAGDVLRMAREDDLHGLALACIEDDRPPEAYFRHLGLPPPGRELAARVAEELVEEAFWDDRVGPPEDLLLHLLQEQDGPVLAGQLIEIIEPGSDGCDRLQEAIFQAWGPSSPRNMELTAEQRDLLLSWAGSVVYADFRQLVDRMRRNASGLRLEHYQVNRLLSRSAFWAAFQSRFRRIRVLLPRQSVQTLGLQGELGRPGLDLLGPGEQVVTCLMDFGTHVVVEVFQGAGETRVVVEGAQELFEHEGLGLTAIRRHPTVLAHDHVQLWQASLMPALMDLGLRPSPGVTDYANGHGNRFPIGQRLSDRQMEDREQSWARWLPTFVNSLPPDQQNPGDVQALLHTWTIRQVKEALGQELKGKVKNIHAKGFGFIVVNGKPDVFVPPSLAKSLKPGMKVRVTVRTTKKGPQALSVAPL